LQIAAGLARLTEMARDGRAELENQYPQAVTATGNSLARGAIERVFESTDATWRGLGELPGSGLQLRGEYRKYDARVRFGLKAVEVPEPAGCRCGEVITGRCTPHECALFARVCTPINPIGPCMVSSEGTCQAWFKYHRNKVRAAGKAEVLS
jgi:hydrogenase expression/formation protein HypD